MSPARSESEMRAELEAYDRRTDALVMRAPLVCVLAGNIGTACGRMIGFPAPEPTEDDDFAPWRMFRRLPPRQQCATCAASRYVAGLAKGGAVPAEALRTGSMEPQQGELEEPSRQFASRPEMLLEQRAIADHADVVQALRSPVALPPDFRAGVLRAIDDADRPRGCVARLLGLPSCHVECADSATGCIGDPPGKP